MARRISDAILQTIVLLARSITMTRCRGSSLATCCRSKLKREGRMVEHLFATPFVVFHLILRVFGSKITMRRGLEKSATMICLRRASGTHRTDNGYEARGAPNDLAVARQAGDPGVGDLGARM